MRASPGKRTLVLAALLVEVIAARPRLQASASEIIDLLAQRFPNPMLFAIQVYEKIVSASLAALTARFDWSALRTYEFNAAGHNHGLLLGSRGWPSRRPGSPDR